MSKRRNEPRNRSTQVTEAVAGRPQHSGARVQEVEWQGPMPPPGALRQFDEIVPGGAERIFVMAEKEQAHRIAVEDRDSQADISDARLGKWMGFVLCLAAIGAAGYSVTVNAPWQVPVAFLSLPLTALIGRFLRRR